MRSCGTTSGIRPCGERRLDEVLVGAHALHLGDGPASGRRSAMHAVEAGDVESGASGVRYRPRNRLVVGLASRTGASPGMCGVRLQEPRHALAGVDPTRLTVRTSSTLARPR